MVLSVEVRMLSGILSLTGSAESVAPILPIDFLVDRPLADPSSKFKSATADSGSIQGILYKPL